MVSESTQYNDGRPNIDCGQYKQREVRTRVKCPTLTVKNGMRPLIKVKVSLAL